MYNSLLGKFKTSSRAAQMNIFYKFRTFLVNPDSPNAGIASTLKDMYAEWLAIGLKFGIDSFLGFILQAAVMDSSAPYKTAFELRVEQIVQNDPAGKCPTFENIMKQLDICKDQHKHLVESVSGSGPAFVTSNPPSSLVVSTQESEVFDVLSFLTDVDEEDWVDALDFYALTAHKRTGQAIGTIVGTIYGHLPSGMVVDSTRFPRADFRRAMNPPSRNQQHARQLADHYRPRYQAASRANSQATQQSNPTSTSLARGGVTAQVVEVNGLPNDLDDLNFHLMALGEDLVSEVAIFDTGASHGFTGSKYLLHDFCSLPKPIGVSVATNGPGSSITGMGNLKFQVPDGSVIVLRQVLYCEQAKTTLISMAALRKANALVAYDNAADAFQIS
ncbi:hypothetical protein PTTG_28617 [Puccinia triticina 1-1 BBBD Race 1]|uniref:Retrovirus-related Pol polyprotein from transposon TNT 1-94-like beta-barrel domain-containing protein n=1 Tax=Puccinia triticina (isolate 1-1 / race 1 (BBBD)) TaxID=630390 RepID=A0A180GBB1_PUCT1|nr:hypothetical protein PTTG_28617 [Puccinia triticina 1-1 BBBD Race 1]